jgi:carbamoylphosphate synthase large subunit
MPALFSSAENDQTQLPMRAMGCFPLTVRPHYTIRGAGSVTVFDEISLVDAILRAVSLSPTGTITVETAANFDSANAGKPLSVETGERSTSK